MSGDGITGLESLRERQSEQGAMIARIDERTRAHGRQMTELATTLDRVARKVDAAVQHQAEAGGQAQGKRSTVTGVKDLAAVLIALSGVVAAVVIGLAN